MTPQEIAVLDECTAKLAEHFDSSLVLVSHKEGEAGTGMSSRSRGNYYSAIGMAKAFLDSEVSREGASRIKEVLD